MLMKTITMFKKVMKGRPIVQYYVQLYYEYDIWQMSNHKNNKVRYLIFFVLGAI